MILIMIQNMICDHRPYRSGPNFDSDSYSDSFDSFSDHDSLVLKKVT